VHVPPRHLSAERDGLRGVRAPGAATPLLPPRVHLQLRDRRAEVRGPPWRGTGGPVSPQARLVPPDVAFLLLPLQHHLQRLHGQPRAALPHRLPPLLRDGDGAAGGQPGGRRGAPRAGAGRGVPLCPCRDGAGPQATLFDSQLTDGSHACTCDRVPSIVLSGEGERAAPALPAAGCLGASRRSSPVPLLAASMDSGSLIMSEIMDVPGDSSPSEDSCLLELQGSLRSVDYVLFRSIQRSRADYCLSVDCVQCSHHARSPTPGLQGPFEETPRPRARGERSYSCSTAEPGRDGVWVGGAVTHSCNRLEGLARCAGPCFPEVRLKEKGSPQGRGAGRPAGPGTGRLCRPRRNSETSCPSSPGLSQRPLVRSHSDPGVPTAADAGRAATAAGAGDVDAAVSDRCGLRRRCCVAWRDRSCVVLGEWGGHANGDRWAGTGGCWVGRAAGAGAGGVPPGGGALPNPERGLRSRQISGKSFTPKHWRTPRPTPPRTQVRARRRPATRGRVGGAQPFGDQTHPVGAGAMGTPGPTGWDPLGAAGTWSQRPGI